MTTTHTPALARTWLVGFQVVMRRAVRPLAIVLAVVLVSHGLTRCLKDVDIASSTRSLTGPLWITAMVLAYRVLSRTLPILIVHGFSRCQFGYISIAVCAAISAIFGGAQAMMWTLRGPTSDIAASDGFIDPTAVQYFCWFTAGLTASALLFALSAAGLLLVVGRRELRPV